MKQKTKSEFGRGFIYNLILFSKHAFQFTHYTESFKQIEGKLHVPAGSHAAQLFFYGACDHLYDIEIPKKYKGTQIEKKVETLKDFCFKRRLPIYDKIKGKDFEKAFDMLEEIVMLLDKDLEVNYEKAKWN